MNGEATAQTFEDVRFYKNGPSSIVLCPKCREGLLDLTNLANLLGWLFLHNEGNCYGETREAEGTLVEVDFGASEPEGNEEEPETR